MSFPARPFLTWTIGFLAFPVAGLAGRAVAGPVDAVLPALLGGAVTGLFVGAGQWLAAGGRLPQAWIAATAAGGSLGLAAGAAAVGYETSTSALAAMGALTGLAVGLAQAATLKRGRPAAGWALAGPALWALGWTVTSLAGVDVEEQYTVFGATGALALTLASWPLLRRLELGS